MDAGLAGAPRLGEAVAKVRAAALDLPPGYQVKLIGQAEEFAKTTK